MEAHTRVRWWLGKPGAFGHLPALRSPPVLQTYDVKPSDFDASVPVSITCDDYTPPN